MAIELITVSTKGQVVLPKDVRDEAGIAEKDKLLVTTQDSKIVLQKVDERKTKKELLGLLDYFAAKFKEAGITPADVEAEIKAARAQKYGSPSS